MHMVGHDHRHAEIDGELVFVKTTVEHNLPCNRRKNPSMMCAERQKMRFIVALEMGQIATAERLGHATNHVGADAGGPQHAWFWRDGVETPSSARRSEAPQIAIFQGWSGCAVSSDVFECDFVSEWELRKPQPGFARPPRRGRLGPRELR